MWSLAATVLAFGCAAALACGGPAQMRYEESLAASPAPERHAVHSARLQELMRSMDRLVQERLPRDMDVDVARGRGAEEIAEVAAAVAATADEISTSVEGLGPDERREFAELAGQLAVRARGLADDAAWLDDDAFRQRMTGITDTCASCHARFRPEAAPRAGD